MAETAATNVVGSMDLKARLADVLVRTLPKLGPSIGDQLKVLLEPTSLAITAGFVGAWIASHAVGIGEVADLVLVGLGLISIGTAVFSGVDELYEFARETYSGQTEAQLEEASRHLAEAISILGVQAVLSVFLKWRPKGGRQSVGAEPKGPRNGWRYSPPTYRDPNQPPGAGSTSFWHQNSTH